VDVITDSAEADCFAADVAANRSQIRVHSWADVRIKPRFAIFCAEDSVNDDVAEGLRHSDSS
jgi:hypothetical protein